MTGNGQETEEVVTTHFSEWGTIERNRVSSFFSLWLPYAYISLFLAFYNTVAWLS